MADLGRSAAIGHVIRDDMDVLFGVYPQQLTALKTRALMTFHSVCKGL